MLNMIAKEGFKLIDVRISKAKELVKYVTGSKGRTLKFRKLL